MKRRFVSVLSAAILLVSCAKKEPQAKEIVTAKTSDPKECSTEIIAKTQVKAGETGIVLPAGTKMCVTKDDLEVRVELPKGYSFSVTNVQGKAAPVLYATYTCQCSGSGSACHVFYAEGMGFGCLQSTCTGSCTGKFTYKGYTVDRLISIENKTDFFNEKEIQQEVKGLYENLSPVESYVKESLYGIPFYLVNNEKAFLSKASCDCEGTKACTLKSVGIAMEKSSGFKIYYCDGPCNGCELTVN